MTPTRFTKEQRSGLAVIAALGCGAANLVFGVWSLLWLIAHSRRRPSNRRTTEEDK